MTERKPPGVDFETWIDRQIREAMERGEFDSLHGTGKPLPNEPADEMWWLKRKLRRENLSYLPPTLALRKEAEDARGAALRAGSEQEARSIIADINQKISEAIRTGMSGPPLNMMPFDVERVVREWREQHQDR